MTGKQLVNSSVLRADNKAARDLSYNPELHNRTKHVARRHFFIRDMVEAFELNVPLISTVNNYADFFTKTLKPGSFSSMRNKIMSIKTGLFPQRFRSAHRRDLSRTSSPTDFAAPRGHGGDSGADHRQPLGVFVLAEGGCILEVLAAVCGSVRAGRPL
eukprot:scaffold36856_cov62-Phaeocystis_antarctica.AAC.1